ncbi:MAG: class I mannose-6-phosphate isomerase [Planctomycetes bacterium]|nr:class I mannose-6-phosphate isomerase [Planctomycetota bacterium]
MSRSGWPAGCGALVFEPHLEERVWGGRELARLGRSLPEGVSVGESWEVSAIRGRASVVASGPWRGLPFDEVLASHSSAILGDVPSLVAPFPLLIKLLDARERLSVQVHPGDEEALAIEGPGEGSVGKTEAWIILAADPGAEIVHSLAPGVEPDELYRRLEGLGGRPLAPDLERSLLRWIPVRAGDVIFVPAGTVHAVGAGVVLAEVQQSSDLTYRIYDWGRRDASGRGRGLHIDKARKVRLSEGVPCPYKRLGDLPSDEEAVSLVECEPFRFERILLREGRPRTQATACESGRGFHILLGWSGRALCEGPGGDRLELGPASIALLPAALGEYRLAALEGGAVLIRIEGSRPR